MPNTTVAGAAKGGIANILPRDNIDYLMELTATYTKDLGNHSPVSYTHLSQSGHDDVRKLSAFLSPVPAYLYRLPQLLFEIRNKDLKLSLIHISHTSSSGRYPGRVITE